MRCFNPHIIIPPVYGSQFKDLKSLEDIERIRADYRAGFKGFLIPCGKCSECLKSRQDDFACRLCRQAAKSGSMIFVTLTYREDTLPISVRLMACDTETGEYQPFAPSRILTAKKRGNPDYQLQKDYLDSIRSEFALMPVGRRSRRIIKPAPFPSKDGFEFYYEFTPSVSRNDFRLYLKRERVRYEREHLYKLPDFKYMFVGEFGPKTCRPHVHACFIGLSFTQVAELLESWRRDYGFIHIEAVKRINNDGTSGFLRASRYIGKYISKGVVECDSVRDGISEKPRICASMNLGTEVTQDLVSYYSAWDIYGPYDPERLCFFDGKLLSDLQVKTLQATILKRSTINVDGFSFVLPKSISNKIWKYEFKVQNPITKKMESRFRSYKIRRLAAISSSNDFMENYTRELFEYCSRFSNRSFRASALEFVSLQEDCIQNKIRLGEENFKKEYSKSFL